MQRTRASSVPTTSHFWWSKVSNTTRLPALPPAHLPARLPVCYYLLVGGGEHGVLASACLQLPHRSCCSCSPAHCPLSCSAGTDVEGEEGGPAKSSDPTNRVLGEHPDTGELILAKLGPYGPYVQQGEKSESNPQPRRTALPKVRGSMSHAP